MEAYDRTLFANTKARRLLKPSGDDWQLYGDVAVRTFNGMFEVETASGKHVFPLRNSYVLRREGQDRKLVAVHISNRVVPAVAPSEQAPSPK